MPFNEAAITTLVAEVGLPAVAAKTTDFTPDATLTAFTIVSTVELGLTSIVQADVVVFVNVAMHSTVLPAATVVGVQASELICGAARRVRDTLLLAPPSVAVSVTGVSVVNTLTLALNFAEDEPDGIVSVDGMLSAEMLFASATTAPAVLDVVTVQVA